MIFALEQDGARRQVEIRPDGLTYTVVDGNETFQVDAHVLASGWWSVLLGARSFDANVERHGTTYTVEVGGRRFRFDLADPARVALRPSVRAAHGPGRVLTPMPGRVLRLLVETGQQVVQGDPLVVVEAMKMENELAAPRDGVITEIAVQENQPVDGGALLLVIGEAPAE